MAMSKENGAVVGDSWREYNKSKGAHLWLIDSPEKSRGKRVKGCCRKCGITRRFPKALEDFISYRQPSASRKIDVDNIGISDDPIDIRLT